MWISYCGIKIDKKKISICWNGFGEVFLFVAGDEIVAATIHLDHLNKNEVLNILRVLQPYDNNMKVLTKKELSTSAGLGSLGLGLKDSAEVDVTAPAKAKMIWKSWFTQIKKEPQIRVVSTHADSFGFVWPGECSGEWDWIVMLTALKITFN